jgi:AraC-like DNA-binding protein
MARVILTGTSGLGPFRSFCDAVGDRTYARVLKATGIPRNLVEASDKMIPLPVMSAVLETAAREAGDEFFGLSLGEAMHPADFGPWIRYVLRGATLRDAIRRMNRAICYHQPGASFQLRIENEYATLSYSAPQYGGAGSRHHADHIVMPLLRLIRQYAGADWRPVAMELNYSRPAHARQLEDRLAAPIRFDRSGVGCSFAAALLDTSRQAIADDRQGQTFSALRRVVDRRTVHTMAGAVRQLIAFGPEAEGVSVEAVARLMGISTRLLQLDLRLEGTSFRDIVAKARFEEARRRLLGTDVPLAELAWDLGYSELPHFSRAFSKAAGMPPGAFRALAQAAR